MIKINLAKTSAFSDEAATSGFALPSFGSLSSGTGQSPFAKIAIIGCIPLGIYIWEQRSLSGQRTKLAQKTTELEQVINDIGQFGTAGAAVADIKIERDRLQARIGVIAKISKKRAFKIQILAKMQELIPEDCWLEKVSIENSNVVIDGFARAPTSVQTFVESLSVLNSLSSVVNQGMSRKQIGEVSVHEFKVIAQLKQI